MYFGHACSLSREFAVFSTENDAFPPVAERFDVMSKVQYPNFCGRDRSCVQYLSSWYMYIAKILTQTEKFTSLRIFETANR